MLETFLTTSGNYYEIFSLYTLIGTFLVMIPSYIADFRTLKTTYTSGDGFELNHRKLIELSDEYRNFIRNNIHLNPFVVMFSLLFLSLLFFALPGYAFAEYVGNNYYILPHFILYVSIFYWAFLSKELQESRTEVISNFAKNVFLYGENQTSNLESKQEEKENTGKDIYSNHEIEKSTLPLVPHSVSVIQEIAADESLPLDIREEADEALRAYEEKQEQEKEQARLEDARISLDVAKKMLE